jgi:glutathione S-transferase
MSMPSTLASFQENHLSEKPLLVIGNKHYSSWSLRPWLLLRHFGVDFNEQRLPLDTPEFGDEIARLSPSRRVPVLHHEGRVIWDSLAICEYVNEVFLDGRGWPSTLSQRALARSASAEMHSGFAAMRSQLPMNCSRLPDAYRWDESAQADIDRVQTLWEDLRAVAPKGDFLCGGFSIVDAMFAPVVIRFHGYGPALAPASAQYVATMLAHPGMRAWMAAGVAEQERLDKYESLRRLS